MVALPPRCTARPFLPGRGLAKRRECADYAVGSAAAITSGAFPDAAPADSVDELLDECAVIVSVSSMPGTVASGTVASGAVASGAVGVRGGAVQAGGAQSLLAVTRAPSALA